MKDPAKIDGDKAAAKGIGQKKTIKPLQSRMDLMQPSFGMREKAGRLARPSQATNAEGIHKKTISSCHSKPVKARVVLADFYGQRAYIRIR